MRGRKFGRERDQRRLMIKNLLVSLVDHGRINTTEAKAKELRGRAERLVTYAKKNTVHHRRLVYRYLQNRTLVKKLFDEIAPLYTEREGGYTRVLKNGYRKGDCAPMAIIEFTDYIIHQPKEEKKSAKKKSAKPKETKVKKEEKPKETTKVKKEEKPKETNVKKEEKPEKTTEKKETEAKE
jgi:large subunit ribosomal protein L17